MKQLNEHGFTGATFVQATSKRKWIREKFQRVKDDFNLVVLAAPLQRMSQIMSNITLAKESHAFFWNSGFMHVRPVR